VSELKEFFGFGLQGTSGGVAAGEGKQKECDEELQVREGGCGWSSLSEKSGS